MNLNNVFSNCLFCFDCDANKQATGLMKSTAQQHIRTWLSLPKKTEHIIGGQYDDSFCPFIMVYPHLNPEDLTCGIHVTASGVEHQPCRARLTERTRRRHSDIVQKCLTTRQPFCSLSRCLIRRNFVQSNWAGVGFPRSPWLCTVDPLPRRSVRWMPYAGSPGFKWGETVIRGQKESS